MRIRRLLIAGSVVVMVVLGVLLWQMRLDHADEWSGVLSMFLTFLSLLVAVLTYLESQAPRRPARTRSGKGGDRSINNVDTYIEGDYANVEQVIHRRL